MTALDDRHAELSAELDAFPADDFGYGFNNIADVLSMSPLLFELYEQAADTLIEIVATSVAGTMVIDYVPRVAGSQVIAQLDDTTANERHRVMNDGIYDVVDGGVTQASVDGGTPTVGALNRVAVTWQANRFAISLNGGAAVEDLSGTVPTTTRLLLASVANASIVRQRLVSGQSVNISQLQALSA